MATQKATTKKVKADAANQGYARLEKMYHDVVKPALQKQFEFENVMQIR